MNKNQMSKVATIIGVDLSKHSFQLHGIDQHANCTFKKTCSRDNVFTFLANTPKATIAMEACSGAHHFARTITEMGHQPKIIAPQFVKPFVTGNKNDKADARAIAIAASLPDTRSVIMKSERQQEMCLTHTTRDALIRNQTKLRNSMRAIISEFGVVCKKGWASLRHMATNISHEHRQKYPVLVSLVEQYMQLLDGLELSISACETSIHEWCRTDPQCKLLLTLPGIGPITATAIVAHIGQAHSFKNGRHMAAYFGLVPKHTGTGGVTRMGSI